eukprot:PhM_4_TR12574/c0_g1_i1/m.54726
MFPTERVLVLYDDRLVASASQILWPPTMVRSPWPNESTTEKLFHKLSLFSASPKETLLHVTQAVLTPNKADIAKGILFGSCFCPAGIRDVAVRTNSLMLSWLRQREYKRRDNDINVFLMDYIHITGERGVREIIQRNIF